MNSANLTALELQIAAVLIQLGSQIVTDLEIAKFVRIASAGCDIPSAEIAAALSRLCANRILFPINIVSHSYRFSSFSLKAADIRRNAAAIFGPLDLDALAAAAVTTVPESWRFRLKRVEYLLDIDRLDTLADALEDIAPDANAETLDGIDAQEFIVSTQQAWAAVRNRQAGIPAALREVLLPCELAEAFFAGKAVEPGLELAVAAAGRRKSLRGVAAIRIAPLCVWTGRSDLLERYAPHAGSIGTPSVELARLFFGKGPTRIVSKPGSYVHRRYDDVQTTLIGLLAAKFSPAPPRLVEALESITGPGNTPELTRFLEGALTASSGDAPETSFAPRDQRPLPTSPIGWLGRTLWHALSSSPARRTRFPEAPLALRAAAVAEAAGCRFLAAQLGGLLAQWPETSAGGIALAARAPAGMPLLWNRTEIAQPWDPLLEELRKALPVRQKARKSPTPRKSDPETLLAVVDLNFPETPAKSEEATPTPCGGISAISLCVAKRRRDGALPQDKVTSTWRTFKDALAAKTLGLEEETSAALYDWTRHTQSAYGTEGSVVRICGSGRESLLHILLGARDAIALRIRIERRGERGRTAWETIEDPVIETRDMALQTAWTPSGSLRMALPPIAWADENGLRIDRVEPRRFLWWRIPPALSPFFALLRQQGGKTRTIDIPKGGAGKAREMLLEAAADGLPVEGAITPAGDAASLDRVAGDVRIVARLELGADALHVQLRARPVAKVPDLVFEPGRGREDIVVPSPRKPFSLHRDIRGEKAVADAVRAALSDFAGEADGDCEWTAETPARQLALLEALRTCADSDPNRFCLEWRNADRLFVRTVSAAALQGAKGADWWLGVHGSFQLDDGTAVALRDLLSVLPRRIGGYVPLDGRTWLRLSSGLRRRLDALSAAGSVHAGELRISPAALPMLQDAFSNADDADGKAPSLRLPKSLERMAEDFRRAMDAEHPVPEGLAAQLRPYQRDGFEWLARLAACGLGACLADDMGLGKTVQLIALLLERAPDGASLVVAPASVCGNWCSELARFAPGLRAVRASGADALPDALGPGDVVVTSYGLLVSRTEQYEVIEWNGVILDEAQAVKNADAKRAQAVKRLRSSWRAVATGTPVENRLSDLWSLFDFLNPGLLGTLDSFRHRFLDSESRPLPALRTLVRPLILRHLKGAVLQDLPPKTEITLTVEPGDKEGAAYETLREEAMEGVSGADKITRRFQILAALTRLRRFCCAPGLVVPGFGTGAKLEALEELLGDLRDNGHRALVFSQFVDVLSLVRPILERHGWGYEYLDGTTPQAERTRRVEAFQRGSAPFFLISLTAGGMGLNLTAANYVVLLDPWWNPAVEDQAADRAHRIGQQAPVTVYRLVMRGTVEEKVLALHGDKRELSAAVLEGTSDAAVSADDLVALFRRD